MLRQQQADLKIADDYTDILERKLNDAKVEIATYKLTDEEILKLFVENASAGFTEQSVIRFARAILRKAQEK